MRGRAAAMAEEETNVEVVAEETSGVESSGDLESFMMKSKTIWGGLLFKGSNISASILD
jgi:hypothetical protein